MYPYIYIYTLNVPYSIYFSMAIGGDSGSKFSELCLHLGSLAWSLDAGLDSLHDSKE